MTNPNRLIRLTEVSSKTGLSKPGVYKRLKEDPTFPRSVSIGGRAVAWIEAEIDEWIETRIAMRGAQTK